MQNLFENNLTLFVFSFFVGVVVWFIAAKINNIRFRRALRASILFLVFPIYYLGHPFLFYQCWMFIVASIVDFNLKWLFIMFGIWGIVILISQKTLKK